MPSPEPAPRTMRRAASDCFSLLATQSPACGGQRPCEQWSQGEGPCAVSCVWLLFPVVSVPCSCQAVVLRFLRHVADGAEIPNAVRFSKHLLLRQCLCLVCEFHLFGILETEGTFFRVSSGPYIINNKHSLKAFYVPGCRQPPTWCNWVSSGVRLTL